MKKLIAVAAGFAALMLCEAAQAQEDASFLVLTNAASRKGIDLSGEWGFSIDPYRDGLYGFHGSPAGRGHQRFDPADVDKATRKEPAALYEYDMRQAPRVTLPEAWDRHTPELRHYEGLMWYERGFDITLKRGERAFVHIGAANYSTRVYVNGALAGEHEGGFTPIIFEVTNLLRKGQDRIALGIDSTRNNASVPPPVTDWETYGGVTRPIKLIVTPSTFIDDAWVRLTRDGFIAASVALNGAARAGQSVRVEIPALEFSMNGETNDAGFAAFTAPAPETLSPWSPEAPTLYSVQVSIDGDSLNERIGFRTIEVDGEEILLNGEPIFLRGISMHEEEIGENPARVISDEAARALLTEIKEGLNGNFVRLAHYPHAEITTRLADELGLIVWSEIPVYWRIDWENAETLATARRMLAENIRRDRNRASIAFWSVANETPVSDARNDFLRTLVADVRALDDTRLVTAALLVDQRTEDRTVIAQVNDPLVHDLDIMSANTYNGWYGNIPLKDVDKVVWRSDHGKPMIFSEFGAGALVGFDDPKLMRKFSEDYQAEYYRQTLRMSDEIPFLKGMSPWILKDFRSPRRQHPVYQNGWNRKGLISETGERKEAYGILSEYYRQKAAVAE